MLIAYMYIKLGVWSGDKLVYIEHKLILAQPDIRLPAA